MRIPGFICAATLLTFVTISSVSPAASLTDFEVYNYVESGLTRMPGRIHVPSSYAADPAKLRPLILFFHGSGESGSENIAQVNGNIDNLLAATKLRDAFLYAPQTNSGWNSGTQMTRAMAMIDRAIAERSVDPNRIYVTGLSMGGGGAWNFLHQYPDRVAATVPICGVGPSSGFQPSKIVNEPIWAFHGRSDTNVPVEVTRGVVNSLLTVAGLPIPEYPLKTNVFFPITTFENPPLDLTYTDYRGAHGIWPQVYNTPALYDWMFTHGAVPEPSTLILVALAALAIPHRPRSSL
jgi:predicted peptidase